MTRRLALYLMLIGVLLAAGSAVLGFSPITRAGAACGSAFHPNTGPAEIQAYTNALLGQPQTSAADQCASAVSDRKTVALTVGVPGVLCLIVGAGCIAYESTRRQLAKDEAAATEWLGTNPVL